MLNEIGPVGSGIYSCQLFNSRLAYFIVKAISELEPNNPSKVDKNIFTTYNLSKSATIAGFSFSSILSSMYSRLINGYLSVTGIRLDVPVFPNPSFTIKSQAIGQLHEVHTDGGDDDNGRGRILHSSTICLNEDYEGGHTQFYLTGTMDKPNIDVDIKLKAGQALIFSADLNYHGITEVTSGSRYSLIQFWRE